MSHLDEAIRLSIEGLFEKNYFCITDAKRIVEAMGGMLDDETEKKWSLLHCKDYSKMSAGLRQSLFDDLLSACNRRVIPSGLGGLLERSTVEIPLDPPNILARRSDRW